MSFRSHKTVDYAADISLSHIKMHNSNNLILHFIILTEKLEDISY